MRAPYLCPPPCMIIFLYRYTRHPRYIYPPPPPSVVAPLRRSSIDPAHTSVPAASTVTLHHRPSPVACPSSNKRLAPTHSSVSRLSCAQHTTRPVSLQFVTRPTSQRTQHLPSPPRPLMFLVQNLDQSASSGVSMLSTPCPISEYAT
jgi:hypothetical protein